MVAYLTTEAINSILGANWANGDEALNITLANNFLNTQPLPFFDVIPNDVIQAGALLAKGYATGELYQVEAELGDVIFTIVNLARFLKVDAEVALNRTNNKFMERFSHVEDAVKNSGRKWNEFTLKELDDAWNEAKVLKM